MGLAIRSSCILSRMAARPPRTSKYPGSSSSPGRVPSSRSLTATPYSWEWRASQFRSTGASDWSSIGNQLCFRARAKVLIFSWAAALPTRSPERIACNSAGIVLVCGQFGSVPQGQCRAFVYCHPRACESARERRPRRPVRSVRASSRPLREIRWRYLGLQERQSDLEPPRPHRGQARQVVLQLRLVRHQYWTATAEIML